MTHQTFLDGKVELHGGDSREVLKTFPDNHFDSVVCDPPYALVSIVKRFGKPGSAPVNNAGTKAGNKGDPYARAAAGFMGKSWDVGETAFAIEFWAEVYRTLKPGGHVVAFSGTRTYHRLACAIEDAGFEIRDQLGYLYGSGFPKSHNVSRKLDDIRCTCSRCETAEPILQHDMRSVRDSDVSASEYAGEERGEVLQPCVPEQSSPAKGRKQLSSAEVWSGESSVEGRSNASQEARELRVGEVCAMPSRADGYVEEGRVRDGTQIGDGEMGGEAVNKDGVRASYRPQAIEQSQDEPGTVAGQSQSQDGGAWPHCGRCGKPVIPDGIGTALKPSWEPICLARKPLAVPVDDVRDADAPARMRSATVAENVLEHGTGALNIDGCRVGTEGGTKTVAGDRRNTTVNAYGDGLGAQGGSIAPIDAGRWPANIVHDGSDEVVACFPDSKAGVNGAARGTGGIWSGISNAPCGPQYGDSGSAARFFYTAKADKLDRIGSKHPTVKPVDLMQWLVRLVTPKGGLTLDPFAGSGSTGEAAWREGMRCVLIEREEEYQADIAERMKLANAGPATRKARAIKQVTNDNLPLFGGVDKGGGGNVVKDAKSTDTLQTKTDGGIMAGKGGFGFRIREHKERNIV